MSVDSERVCPFRQVCWIAASSERTPTLRPYARVYCDEQFTLCERYVELDRGRTPPESLLPDGGILPDPEREPEAFRAALGRAPVPPDEPARLAALHRYDILDTPPERGFDELVQLASELCGTPIALVSLVDAERQWFKARVGLDATETPRDQAFCAHAILDDELLEVPDARDDPRFAHNPLVTGEPDIRFYAGQPLVTTDGQRLGTLCVIDRSPRTLNEQQRRALAVLGRQVVAQLELRASVEALARQTQTLQSNRQDLVDAFFEVLDVEEEAEVKRSFISRVTHELRTPLNSVLGLSELLLEDDSDAEQRRKDLRLVNRAAQHMLSLVNGILDLAALESGAVALGLDAVDLRELTGDVVALLRPVARRGNNRLRVTIAAGAETTRTDATKLRQILLNIIGNACNYTADGLITVALSAGARDGAPVVRFVITDTGVGMSEEQLARLFEGFTRFTDAHLRRTEGTGLGMMITRALVERLEGSISVESEPGVGTRFTVTLPAAPAG